MSEEAGTPALERVDYAWLAAAVIVGAASAAASSLEFVAPGQVFVAVLALAITALVLWRAEFGPVLIVLTLPLDVAGRIYQGPVTITLFHLALLVSLLSWAIRVAQSPGEWLRFSILDVGIVALIGAVVWSMPHSLYLKGTVVSLVRLVFLWLFTLLYANLLRTRADVGRVLAALGLAGAATSLLVLFQYRFPDIAPGNLGVVAKVGGEKVTRVSGFFDDPNYLAGFLTVVIVAALAETVHARRLPRILPWLAVFGVSAAALMVTLSRTGWVAVLVGILVVVLTAPAKRRMPLIVAGALVAGALAAGASATIIARFESITDVRSDRSVGTRVLMIESTVDIIREYWVWGTGLNAFDHAYPVYRRPGSIPEITRPHQIPLAMWAEMGVAGLAAEIVLLLAIVTIFVRRRAGPWTMVESLALGGTLTLLAQTVFQYYLYFEPMWLMFALCVVSERVRAVPEAVPVGGAA